MTARIGVDTGGTFTDFVLFDETRGTLSFHKIASTPDDPSRAIVEGIHEITDGSADSAGLLAHGTTVATNTILQRKGARAALVTTRGFRDVLHIQRQERPSLYDMRMRRAEPLIPRELRFELTERMLHDGTVLREVDHNELNELVLTLKAQSVEAVVVGFLHSYANPAHELEVGNVLVRELPEVTVCLSHEISGEHGEVERFSTAAMNAYVQPVMQHYLERLATRLSVEQVEAPLFVMKSNGGVMSAGAAGRQCVETILSGPAGGVVTGEALARVHDNNNLITADMGGTSFDVSVIHEGRAGFARDSEMGGLALSTPMLDIHTVGAGGGSIGWIDAGGSLRVGPRSAGAVPGPACYGRGGEAPTVTDANLVLGRLGSASLLGGGMELDLEAGRRAVHDHLARPLGLPVEAAAEGMVRVVNAAMTAAIRKLTVERGFDPREFTLCPFGGAGPLHGAELAAEVGIKETLVPIAPGVTSAIGLLMSNPREDRVRTHIRVLRDELLPELESLFGEMEEEAITRLTDTGREQNLRRRLGLRYLGQSYDLPIPVEPGGLSKDVLMREFHAAHQRSYGYARADETVEVASVWVSVEADLQPVALPVAEEGRGTPAPVFTREVMFSGQPIETSVYRRDTLGAGHRLEGPAIIEQLDSTTVLWPNQALRVDSHGNLLLGGMP
jgi:N-methylhydantoinase A